MLIKKYFYNPKNKVESMGFYSTKTPEQKRIQKLTGDINISDAFKRECNARGIAIYNAYNIQKKLIFEAEEEKIHGIGEVDRRLMELLDERSKNKVSHNYIELIETGTDKTIPDKSKASKIPDIPILPRSRDGKTFTNYDNNDLLNEIIKQNHTIIKQNNIIIELLEKIGEKL